MTWLAFKARSSAALLSKQCRSGVLCHSVRSTPRADRTRASSYPLKTTAPHAVRAYVTDRPHLGTSRSAQQSHLSPEALALLPRHRMISPDKLWEEILHNVQKEATEAQSSITLSAHQMETLTAAIDIPSRDGAGGGDGPTQTAVLFTCGHHMPRRTLLVEAVPQLEVHLAEMDMPQSAALLSSQYAHKGAMAVACPKCVLNTIRTT